MAKKRLVIGNWKMYIESLEDARAFALTLRRKARGYVGVDVMIVPPSPLISTVANILASSPVRVGAQTVSTYTDNKHTGDVSAHMLKEVGASFVIIGHSERRAAGETDAMIRTQLERATAVGLTVVLCVGETERGKDGEHFSVIERQLVVVLDKLPKQSIGKVIIAYEPVWAIGKEASQAMHGGDLQEMYIFIKKVLTELLDRKAAQRIPILYGGSVDATNAHALLDEGGVSGFLVGHASVQIESFLDLLKALRKNSV